MFSNGISRALLLLASLPLSGETAAEPRLLTVTPDTCVALNQGRTCYATIAVTWHSELPGDYCLQLEDQTQPLHCWQKANQGHWQFEFAAEQSTRLLLTNGQQTLAKHEIQVNWVYKSQRRKRGWRLF
ncbi:DUF3019 domain-containing protein [Bowmanella dokdonensis]|uniref:DUF3019 domain-containing protein n=1 Tax=Bowmanella dokdonensis TaxID=751969 RepID=A0A939DMA9_9ALTE|nr:DUF3019 domain-containing protein [Bowmanella dokdonensis]MBN7825393.1 DUF3019 domain-containing protein [Bowmanella dokdonensis]